MSDQGVFSVPALFIVFRETLEAAIVCSVLLGVLAKTNLTHLNRYVWLGLVLGLCLTGVILVATIIAFQVATDRLIDKDGSTTSNGTSTEEEEESISEGEIRLKAGLSFSAAILIALMCWTLGDILKKQTQLEKEILAEAAKLLELEVKDTAEVPTAAQNGTETVPTNETAEQTQKENKETAETVVVKKKEAVTWWTVFFLAFTAVAREGVETVVFLGVGSGFDGKSLPIPIAVGFVSGSVAGVLLYRLGNSLALKWFFRISVVFLLFVGAGIFAHGIEELYHLGDFGWWGELVYNISLCCGLRKPGWALFRALFGYTPYPTRAEMFGYFMYHAVVIIGFFVKWTLERNKIDVEELAKKGFIKLKNKLLLKNKQEVEKEEQEEELKAERLEQELKEIMGRDKDKEKVKEKKEKKSRVSQVGESVVSL